MMDNAEIVRTFRSGLLSADQSLLRLLRDGYEGRMVDLHEIRDSLSIPVAYVESDEAHDALSEAIYGITKVIAAHETVLEEIKLALDSRPGELGDLFSENAASVH